MLPCLSPYLSLRLPADSVCVWPLSNFAWKRVILKKAHYTLAKAVFLSGLYAVDLELEERKPYSKEFFDFSHPGFVDQEHNNVVIRLYPQMVVGDQYLVMAHDGTNGCTLG